ncbi:Crp/Fnr family transcriptional regulator [Dankookia rubra]|nr:Crp/Fnr family transcriptional regulator [Dankookia rubra]
MDRRAAEAILLSRGWLPDQPADFQAALLAGAEPRHFRKGEVVFQAGDGPGGLYGIVAGSFGTYVSTPYSAPALSHILHPGWWCGEGPALGGPKRVLTVRSMESSWAMHLPYEAARALVLSNPAAARSVGQLGQIAMRVAIANVAQLMIRRADRRIGAVLLRVTGALDEAALAPTGDIRLTQLEIARMANASRNLVNKSLAQFEAAGWVRLGYNRIAVLDSAALADFAYQRG